MKQVIINPKQVEAKHIPLSFLVVFIRLFALQYLIKLVNIIISKVINSINKNRSILATEIFDHLIIINDKNNKKREIDWNTSSTISKDFDVKLLKQQHKQQYKIPIFKLYYII
jgi:hypothetical protein